MISTSLIFAPTVAYSQTAPQNNIVVDGAAHAGGQNPSFDRSPNGTDVLNIVAPTQLDSLLSKINLIKKHARYTAQGF